MLLVNVHCLSYCLHLTPLNIAKVASLTCQVGLVNGLICQLFLALVTTFIVVWLLEYSVKIAVFLVKIIRG